MFRSSNINIKEFTYDNVHFEAWIDIYCSIEIVGF